MVKLNFADTSSFYFGGESLVGSGSSDMLLYVG